VNQEKKQMLGIFGTNEFEKIVGREIALTNRKRGAIMQLASAKEAAGSAMVDGEGFAEVEAVAKLTGEIDTLSRAVAIIRERRPAAITAEYRKEAEVLRARQAAKQKELTSHTAKVLKLVAQLSDLEGVKLGEWLYTDSGGNARSEKLELEIRDLNQKADALESAGVAHYGCTDLDGVTTDAEVIEAILRHKSAGPSVEAIQKWISACANSNRVPDCDFGASPRRVRVEWNDGEIDLNASYIFVLSLTKKRTGVMQSNGIINPGESTSYDLPSGQFRAAA
jgi:hypothetical protein